MFICVIFGLISLQCVSSYKIFQSSIPNGAAVPFPCKSGQIWQGVGHLLDEGTGTRNLFGLDFEAEGNTWTEKLCRKDSDGDGLTNGDELGDPDCKWKPNSGPPNRTTQITHPGICDSWDSPDCMKKPLTGSRYQTQQQWLAEMCKSDGLNCPAMNETGVQRVELRLPAGSRIPPKETTYQCMMFDLYAQGVPQDKELHMVAVTPIIDNRNVLHHAVLFGCTNDTEVKNVSQECGMLASPSCSEFLHVWTVGLDGECYHPEAGIKIGLKGYRIVAIQLHWNNPSMRADYTDTSGLLVYYTPKLRRYNAGVLMVGSANFYLPPKREEILIQGKCSGACTSSGMNGTIYVTSAWNHMHYAGNKMNIQLVRPDNSTRYLTNERVYSYDSPQVELFTTGLEINPGDSLISNCGYQTMNRNKTTFWGEATKEEMCFGFLTYYPRENMRQRYCVDFQGVSQCDRASFEGCVSLGQFLMAINTTAVYRDVASNCRSFFPCIDECVETIVHYMRTEKCMQGNIWNYIQDELARGNDVAREFLSRLYSCKTEVYMALNSTQNLALNSTKLAQTGCEPDAALRPTSGTLTVLIVVLAVLTTMMY